MYVHVIYRLLLTSQTACDLLVNLGSMAHVFLRTLVPVLATLDLDLKRFNDLHECAVPF